jgi:hypothetical protein
MGRWSRHPMGSDGALDARDEFMEFADILDENNERVCFFERPEEEIRNLLLGLTLDDLKEKASSIEDNTFVIPYTFIDYGAYPTDPDIKKFLKECLENCEDFDWYGNGEEQRHVDYFKEHFDEIISGQLPLPSDEGLFAAINAAFEKSDNPGLINLTKDN